MTLRILVTMLVCLSVSLAVDNELNIPSRWLPTHTQNGQEITAIVRLFVNTKDPFKDPESGKDQYQSKAVLLKSTDMMGNDSSTSMWVYLITTNSLPSNATLRISGKLSVSDRQVKGGEYPTTVHVGLWENIATVGAQKK